MLEIISGFLNDLIAWTNENEGFLSLVLFLVALIFGWVSGIFQSLRRRPKFDIDIIAGPTFCCTFGMGEKLNEHEIHRTAIALYLKIANVGSAASDIDWIEVGYHNYTFKYTFLWYWLQQTTSLEDFSLDLEDGSLKLFPFLQQKSFLTGSADDTFLEVGKAINGMMYFEQPKSWGGFYPRDSNGQVKIKIRVRDVFDKSHSKVVKIPKVDVGEARKFNKKLGMTIESMGLEERPS
jgi:hypothetical protein